MAGLSFVSLVAYDYRYAYSSIRSYYDIADEIIVGVDIDRLTYMKRPFHFDMGEFQQFVSQIDREGKIRVVEQDFHVADHPMGNEVRERQILSKECKPGNWVVQIDVDEVFLNGPEFKAWLTANNPQQNNVFGRWIAVFKCFGNQVLIIDPPGEPVPVATMTRNEYTSGRLTPQPGVMSPLQMLHFSWGRTPEELAQKLTNWSHAKDFNLQAFFDMWQSVTLENYQQFKNFHPLHGPAWQSLKLATLNVQPG